MERGYESHLVSHEGARFARTPVQDRMNTRRSFPAVWAISTPLADFQNKPRPSAPSWRCRYRLFCKMANSMDFEDVDFDQHIDDGDAGQRKRRKRVRNWTAEDRARHRVFERSRREAFNERLNVRPIFRYIADDSIRLGGAASWTLSSMAQKTDRIPQELASLLPTLKDAKETQLSKHVIVDESVKHHISQRKAIDGLSRSLKDLRGQHEQLLAEVDSWRRAAAGLSTGGLAIAPGTHTVTSPTPQASFTADAEVPAVPVPYDGVREMQPHAASQTRPIPSELDTYPGNLVPLVSDFTSTQNAAALDALNGPMPRPNVSEMGRTLGDVQGSLAPPGASAAFETEGLQSMFDHFHQDPTPGSRDLRADRMYSSDMQHPTTTEIEPWTMSPGLEDLWRTHWTQNNPNGWDHPNTAADYGELSAMHFRSNNASIMNV